MQITIKLEATWEDYFVIRIYGRRTFFFYWMNDIYKSI